MRVPEDRATPPSDLPGREEGDRARFDLDDRPITPSNRDLVGMSQLLNGLLAGLLVSSLQYEQHAQTVRGPSARTFGDFLLACADRDRGAAGLIAMRIRQFGFVGDYDPEHLSARSEITFQAFPEGDFRGIVAQNLISARILVQTLQEAVRWISDDDATTRQLLERLLADKEAEADKLRAQHLPQESFLGRMDSGV